MSQPMNMPDPGPVMQMMTAFWASGTFRGAVDLDLFTHVSHGADTVEKLAVATRATPRGIRAIADALVALGFLTKDAGRYANTPVAATWACSDKPTFLAGFSKFLNDSRFTEAFGRVAEAAREGKSVFDKDAESPENPLWVTFAQSSLPMALGGAMPLPDILQSRRPGLRILDVAAGSGGYGITLAQASTGSKLTFLDWANVAAVSKRHADLLGVGDRASILPGSALDVDWGGPYDVVVMGNFFHHFDMPTCVSIAGKAKKALAPGGVFATAEFVADEERKAASMPLLFSVAMLLWSTGGAAYTFSELSKILRDGGFAEVTHHAMGDNPSSWVVAR
ncbi:MAG TPA: methyltransferase [Polyangiaceae bacterium]|nr:methyltransferase [Polyangiaceae bacterium]